MDMERFKLTWDRIEPESYVDGPGGPRTVLWTVGCPIQCQYCQNRRLWEPGPDARVAYAHLAALELLRQAGDRPLTITGGEPMFQPQALWAMLACIRAKDLDAGRPRRHIIVYSGYTWGDLLVMAESIPDILHVLDLVDVLVDGPYDRTLNDDRVQWRGSSNQRVIDVQASIDAGALDDSEKLVLLDWDTPTLTLTTDGRLLGAAGLMRDLHAPPYAYDLQPTRRCGHASEA